MKKVIIAEKPSVAKNIADVGEWRSFHLYLKNLNIK